MNRWKKLLRKNSILNYILIFSLLVIAILAVMGGFILRSFHGRIQEDYTQHNALVLSTLQTIHENEVQILKDISTQMNLSEDSTDFLLEEQPRKSTPLRQRLTQYRAVNHFFDEIYYYYQRDDYLYNHSTSMALSYFCEKGYLLEDMTPQAFAELLRAEHREMVILPEQAISGKLEAYYDVFSPSAVYLLPVAPDYDSIMFYFVGSKHFDAMLAAAPEERRNSYILYEGRVIAARGSEPISNEEILARVADLGDGQAFVQFDHGSYLATVQTGASGFTYCTVQSAELLNARMWTGSWSVLLILLACSIPAALLITGGARRLLQSFKSINSLLQTEDSLYSFDSVESGVQALIEESSKIRDSSAKLKKTRFVRGFVRSDYQSEADLRRDAQEAGFALELPLFCVVVIGNRHVENQAHMHEMVLRMMADRANITGYGLNLISSNQTVLLLFGRTLDDMLDFCRELIDRGRQMNGEMIVAISDAHEDLLTGSKAYIEADVAFSSRFLYDQNAPICYRDIESRQDREPYPDAIRALLNQFRNAIQFRNAQDADRIIDEICDYLKRHGASLITFRFIFDDIQHILVLEWRGDGQNLNQFYNVFTLARCLTIDDFRALLKEASRLVLSNDENTVRALSEMVQKSIDYMKEHYRNPDLNMSALADRLNISPVTLSMEFKNETGISPSEYLTSLRISQAKILLRDTDLLVREISAAVGYEDEHVFTRRFKKYTGVTPGQYRTGAEG